MTVLITRPIEQARLLQHVCHEKNIECILFPTVAIKNIAQHISVSELSGFANGIFVSPNAVDCFFAEHIEFTFSQHQQLFAMGPGTAQALKKYSEHDVIIAQPNNSVGMLASLQNVTGSSMAIFVGKDGKSLLQDSLQERGEKVALFYTHQRQLPNYELPLAWSVDGVSVIVLTSGQILQNLNTLITKLHLEVLYVKPIVVITNEMAEQARRYGFSGQVAIATSADNLDLLSSLQQIYPSPFKL